MSHRLDPAAEELRLEELKRKVHDELYIAGAILRIAQVMSSEIMNGYGAMDGGRQQRHKEALW